MRCIALSQRAVVVLRRVLIAGVMILSVSSVRASTINFAAFQQSAFGSAEFAYLNNGPGTDPSEDAELVSDPNGISGAGIPVVFEYLSFGNDLPADLQGPQDATVTLTSSTMSDVATGFQQSIDDQQVMGTGDLTDTLAITRDTPASEGTGSRTNLLSLTFTGQLFGEIGGLTPQLSGSTSAYTVDYTSDFLSFAGSTERDYAITFTSWTTDANDANDGLGLMPSTDNFFEAATAAGSGTFDSNVVTVAPEAATFASMLGASFSLLLRRRRTLSPAQECADELTHSTVFESQI
jgi:hypothetical protein